MRLVWFAALAAWALVLGNARAQPAASLELTYVAAGAELSYVAARVPLPAERLGALVLHDAAATGALAAASAPGQGALEPRPPALAAPAPPPPGWPVAGVAAHPERRRGRAPLGARAGGGCDCATAVADAGRERLAVVYASVDFEVGAELERLGLLELRARRHEGLVAFINGVEVARRNLPPGAAAAERVRGPEWETFYVPVTPGLLRPGQNLLAVEVRPSRHRDAVGLDLELIGRAGGRVVRGPMVQRVGPSSAVIAFGTDLPVTAAVELLGPSPRRVASAGGSLARHHQVRIDGLAPGQAVRYRVIAGGEVGAEHTFHAAPPQGEPIRFAVYGDTRGGHAVHARIISALVAEAPDFVLVTGDLVARGSDEADWQRFFAIAGPLLARVPYYPAAGNHDVGRSGDEQRHMNEIFALWPGPADRPTWGHWYSFDVAGVHVVMLDSNNYEQTEQLAWLRRDLAAAQAAGARAIFAVTHDGPYSRGPHGGDEAAAELYAPLLAEYGVTMLFSGHDHIYQRGQVGGLRYLVSGGGGAPLYRITCGGPGRRRCAEPDGAERVERAYHYVMVTVYDDHAQLCAKRPDASPLEPCVTLPL